MDSRWTLDDCTASSTHFRTCGGDREMQRMRESWVIYIMGNAASFWMLQIRSRIRMPAGAFEKSQESRRKSHGAFVLRRLTLPHTHTHTVTHLALQLCTRSPPPNMCKAFIRGVSHVPSCTDPPLPRPPTPLFNSTATVQHPHTLLNSQCVRSQVEVP